MNMWTNDNPPIRKTDRDTTIAIKIHHNPYNADIYFITFSGRRIGVSQRLMFRVDGQDGFLVTSGYWKKHFSKRRMDMQNCLDVILFENAVHKAMTAWETSNTIPDDGTISKWLSSMGM